MDRREMSFAEPRCDNAGMLGSLEALRVRKHRRSAKALAQTEN